MSSRSKAFASYMNDIYSQYDLLLERIQQDDTTITLAPEDTTNFAILGDMAGADIEALAFLVLMQAAKSAQEDLKAIMDEVRAINQVKQRQRELLEKLKSRAGEAKDDQEADDDKTVRANPCTALDTDLVMQLMMLVTVRQSDQELIAAADQVILARNHYQRVKATDVSKDELDSLIELSEMEQLRPQLLLDRRAKFMEMLSNLLKKMSETQKSIIENLK